MSALGPTQRLVLEYLAQPGWLGGWPPTAREIADGLALAAETPLHLRRPTAETEQVQSTLARLARRGLVERRGSSPGPTPGSTARCWAITQAGRDALGVEVSS